MLSLPADDPGSAGELDPLESAIAASPPEPGAQLLHWVLVTEWVDPEGFREISGQANCAPWTAEGLVRYVVKHDVIYDNEGCDDAG